MKDEKKTPETEARTGRSAPPEKKPEETRPKPGFVFKILPADPKNTLDFEDVADK